MTDGHHWIDSDAALSAACDLWREATVLAMDTEFVRTETYFAQLGLIQVGHGGQVWLIDPLAITEWRPLAALLEDDAILKVFHSLSEDAEVLLNGTGACVAPVFDTQVAAAMLGHDLQMGFARLVEAEFDVLLPKDVTRSDWLKRPLDADQCAYAAADVEWLERLFNVLAPRLNDQGRFDWVVEDSNRAARDSLPPEPAVYYRKLRGAWKLKGARLLCLQRLAEWRETEARERNVNRSRVLSDAEIIQIAQIMPRGRSTLSRIKGLHPRKLRQFGDTVIRLVAEAEQAPRDHWPERLPGPLPADQAELFRGVKSRIAQIADQVSLPAEVLARRKQLEQLVRSGCYTGEYRMPDMMTGWRHDVVAEPLMAYLTEQRDASDE